MLFLAVIPASTSGVGESGLRGKLIFGLVLLALGSAGTIYLLVKALPRLRLATSTRCGWKIGLSGLLTAALAVVVVRAVRKKKPFGRLGKKKSKLPAGEEPKSEE